MPPKYRDPDYWPWRGGVASRQPSKNQTKTSTRVGPEIAFLTEWSTVWTNSPPTETRILDAADEIFVRRGIDDDELPAFLKGALR